MSDERLAYSLREAAEKLGGISVRTVQRLVAIRVLPALHVLRRVLIPAEALHAFVAGGAHLADNGQRAESVAWKESEPCHTDERTHRIGGSNTPTQAASELTGLLVQLTKGKRKPSKPSGGLRRIK
jgi:excisionase family DNA binding protein